jgi:HlyD family secretion protein
MGCIKSIIQIVALVFLISSCSDSEKGYDASGSFEAIERTISAEATGKIKSFKIEEGQLLKAGDIIGSIDVSNLTIQSEQMQSSINAINEKTNSATSQIIVLQSQLRTQESQVDAFKQQLTNIEKEVKRFQNLVQASAVPQKQLDDLVGQKLVLQKQLTATKTKTGVIRAQIGAAKTNVNTQNRAILSEIEPNKRD